MKRFNTMKNYFKPAAAAVALMLVAGPASAGDNWLAAKAFTKTLPDGSSVPMWGYVKDTGDGTNAHCYDITGAGSVALRDACVAGLPDPMVPGPRLTVSPDEELLRVYLTNGLPEPTSVVIPGQEMPNSSNNETGPTWNTPDGDTGARTDPAWRVRSFGLEAAPNGGRRAYTWASGTGNPIANPGTFIYHSGTHPQKQVYMGLYGAVTKDEVAEDIVAGISAEAYPGVPYDNEVILFYSDIDPVFNEAVAAGTLATAINYNAQWFLVNGEPYEADVTEDIPAGLASVPGTNTRSDTLVRFLSAASETHVPVIQGLRMTIHAEDGLVYTWQNGATVVDTAPRNQYSAMLPALKTKDAIIAPTTPGRYAVYDGNGYMTNPSDISDFDAGDTVGGMLRFLTVGDANLVPVAVNDTAETDEDTAVIIDVVANDSDPDGNGLTVISVTTPTSGTAVITDPTCCVTYTPNANFNGTDQFDYTITDGNGVTSTATAFVDVTVNAVNDLPVLDPIPDQTATTSQPYSYQVTATDVDVPPDVLTFSLDLGPLGMTIDPSTGLISWTPTVQQDGSHDVTVRVTDSALAIDTQAYTIDVTLVNVAPVITSTPVTTATAGQAYTYDVDAADADLGDTQTWSLDVMPDGMTIDTATGVIDWTPTMAQLGGNPVTVTVTDFHGLTASQSYTVTVDAAAGSVFFSTLQNATVPGVVSPYNNADIYAYDSAAYSRILAFVDTMGFNANVDALHMVDADTFYISFLNTSVNVPGIGAVQDEDVVLYDAGTWSLYFDGATCGLNANGGQDIDAISIEGGTLYFSTAGGGNSNPVGGVAGPYDNADVYTYSGGGPNTCGRALDGSAVGLPGNANIDGLTVQGGTYYMSFNRDAGTNVPGLGSVADTAVVSYSGGPWAVYFSGPDLTGGTGQDLDAVHVP